jgi:hypothetical protein
MSERPHIEVPTNEAGEPFPYDVVIDPRTGKPHVGPSLDELRAYDERLIAEASDRSRDGNDDE